MQTTMTFATKAIRRWEKKCMPFSFRSGSRFLEPNSACEKGLRRVARSSTMCSTYLKWTLWPVADSGLYHIIDATTLLTLFDG